MKTEAMIAVRDVEASSAWYQQLLGVQSDHGGTEFDRLVDGPEVVLLLHHWGAPEHPSMLSASDGPIGQGLVLYFRASDLDAVHRRAKDLQAQIMSAPAFNPQSRQREFTLRDPDGYVLTICS
jgi:predicted enzyme related to lactoylglutathione lyase